MKRTQLFLTKAEVEVTLQVIDEWLCAIKVLDPDKDNKLIEKRIERILEIRDRLRFTKETKVK